MLHPDATSDSVQAFRSVHKSQRPSTVAVVDPDDIAYIDCHPDPDNSQKSFILWGDIKQAFESALFVRDSKAKILPFVKGKDYRRLEPRRIVAVPGVVLDVVVGGELTTVEISSLPRTVQGLSITNHPQQSSSSTPRNPPQQPSSSSPRNPAYGLEEEAMQNYNHIEPPETLQSSSRSSQAIPARDGQRSGGGNDASTNTQSDAGTTNTRRHDAPQDLGASTSMSLIQTMISASQGDVDSQFALGNRFREGREVHRDCRAAMDWYLKAADQDHAQAQFMIGVMYFQNETLEHMLSLDRNNGDSIQVSEIIPQDESKALEWFLKAAHQGLADAQFGVVIVMMEIHDDPDPETILDTLSWCRKAANQNHGPAQAFMGVYYLRGFGVPKDASQASEWYFKAVERSGGAVEHCLAQMHEEGDGVPQDDSKAFEWYLKSAEQGWNASQLKVANRYENGEGIPANREKAIEWYTKAFKDGNQDAKVALDRLTGI
ncbi:hypothetical protein EC991_007696 [Linnemannia zychae]|nr:hypothetical protein EC991_007696 [Linnemannia zychae]